MPPDGRPGAAARPPTRWRTTRTPRCSATRRRPSGPPSRRWYGPLNDTLGRVSDQLARAEVGAATAQAELREQVRRAAEGAESVRSETGRLVTALRRSEVRGRWGEVHLRRAVELAGLVEPVRLHRAGAASRDGADPRCAPTCVVRLAGGRAVVVDAKVPLDAYLDATSADDDDAARRRTWPGMRAQLRTHVERCSAKSYWRSLPETPGVRRAVPAGRVVPRPPRWRPPGT